MSVLAGLLSHITIAGMSCEEMVHWYCLHVNEQRVGLDWKVGCCRGVGCVGCAGGCGVCRGFYL